MPVQKRPSAGAVQEDTAKLDLQGVKFEAKHNFPIHVSGSKKPAGVRF